MRSNEEMANRQEDGDLRFAQVSALQLTLCLGLAWLGLALWSCGLSHEEGNMVFTCILNIRENGNVLLGVGDITQRISLLHNP